MQDILLYHIYLSVYLPILVYPIPYFTTKLISQPNFIKCCKYRMITLITGVFIYLISQKHMILSDNNFFKILGIILIISGQYLNLAVYYKLGEKGVYYGLQYRTIMFRKLSNEFPFYISHPQYLGGVLSYIGVYFLTAYNNSLFNPVLTVLLINILLVQTYLIIMERLLDKIYK